MPHLTTTEAARQLGTDPQNVRGWCRRHKVPQFAGRYRIDRKTFARIKARLGKPGREKKEEPR